VTATIKLMVRSGSGVLSAVASRLQGSGIRVKSHSIEAVDENNALLIVSAESAEPVDEAAVRSALGDVEGVRSIEDVSAQVGQPGAPSAGVEIPAELVDRITHSFPKIMPHIQNYEEKLASDPQKSDKLRQLGVDTGRKLGTGADSSAPESVDQLIDEVILPAVEHIAEASRDGEKVVVPVSLFTRRVVTSMDLFSGEGEKCEFMCGLLEGLAVSTPGFERMSVTEAQCRANGDSACVFKFA